MIALALPQPHALPRCSVSRVGVCAESTSSTDTLTRCLEWSRAYSLQCHQGGGAGAEREERLVLAEHLLCARTVLGLFTLLTLQQPWEPASLKGITDSSQ